MENHHDAAPGRDLSDPEYRQGVLELLGVLAYGELMGFFTIVGDAENAPRMPDRVALARVAINEFHEYERLVDRIRELDGDPEDVMGPVAPFFHEWHHRTRPSGWLEGLMKVYAGSSLAADFYREIAVYVDPQTRALVDEVLSHDDHMEFVVGELRQAIEDDATVGGRLALYGRRMMGEALSQAQRVAAEREGLTNVLVDNGSGHGADLAELSRLFARITEAHTQRMEALGLSA